MYSCQSNEERRHLTLRALEIEECMTPDQLLAVAVGLLSVTSYGDAVQAYGAVMLRRAIHRKRVRLGDVPFWELLTYYCNEPCVANLLCGHLLELFVEYFLNSCDNLLPQLLEVVVCPMDDISSHPRRVSLLFGIVREVLEPDFNRVPRPRLGTLRNSMKQAGTRLLVVCTQTLHGFYSAVGAEASAVPPHLDVQIEECLGIMGLVAPLLSLQEWVQIALGDSMHVLLRWPPSRRYAVAATSAMLCCAEPQNDSMSILLRQLLESVLAIIPGAVDQREIDVVEEVLLLLGELPKSLVRSGGLAVCHALLAIFYLPSIYFACEVCSILQWMEEETLKQLNPFDVYTALHALVRKGQFDPETGTHKEGVMLSLEQLGFVGMYHRTWADFRGQAGKLLDILSCLHPAYSNQFVLGLLGGLVDPTGTPKEFRTRGGFVTQQSDAFLTWEAIAFMVDHLSNAFPLSSEHIQDCIAALVAHQPTDAVLLPLFLNLMSCFWRCTDDPNLHVWEGTLGILFRCLQDLPKGDHDLDISAARRRAHTLLITASTEHAIRMGPAAKDALHQLRSGILGASSTERAFIYEAIVGFAVVSPPEERDGYLQSIIAPLAAVLEKDTLPMTQPQFNDIVVGSSYEERDMRSQIREALTTLAAIFRRCGVTPYIHQVVTRILPVLSHLMCLLHGIRAADLPRAYQGILEMPAAERAMFLPGQTKKSDAAEGSSHVHQARTALVSIRIALYQVYGAISPVAPQPSIEAFLQEMNQGLTGLPIHHTRQLTEKCLLPIAQHHPQVLAPTLVVLRNIFIQRGTQQRAQEEEQQRQAHAGPSTSCRKQQRDSEVIDGKSWFYFAKDVRAFMRTKVLESGRWRDSVEVMQATCELLVAILESDANPREGFYMLKSFMELSPPEHDPAGVGRYLAQGQMIAFSRLLRYIIYSSDAVLPPKDRESLAFQVSEPYVASHPRFETCWEAVEVPADLVSELQARLLLGDGSGAQRRKVKEFILNISKTARGGV